MPRRRKFAKLTKEEQERNKDVLEKCFVTVDGENKWMLTECCHSDFEEIQISAKLTCEACVWEGLDTDAEYDPDSD